MTITTQELSISNPWRSVGVWMATLLALSQLANAIRAVLNPAGFASNLGLPLEVQADAGFVFVYALRATFLGLFALFLIARREFAVLKWFALLAVLMPLGDFVLTCRAGAAGDGRQARRLRGLYPRHGRPVASSAVNSMNWLQASSQSHVV